MILRNIAISTLVFAPLALQYSNAHSASLELSIRNSHFAARSSITSERHIDFDGDGKPEVIFINSANSGSAVEVFGRDDEHRIRRKQTFFSENMGSRAQPIVWMDNGHAHLGIAGELGLAIYSGWPLRHERTIQLEGKWRGSNDVSVSDINADGSVEIVAFMSGALNAYSIVDGRLLWSIPRSDWRGGNRPLILQMDADPALEVIAATDGGFAVIDAITHSIDEIPSSAYRSDLLLSGRFFPNARGVFNSGAMWSLLRTDTWESVWIADSEWWPEAAIDDLDGDQIDEIVLRTRQSGTIAAMDARTKQIRPIPTPYTATFAVSDIDADGRAELLTREWVGDDLVTVVTCPHISVPR